MPFIEWTPRNGDTPESLPGIVQREIHTPTSVRIEFSSRSSGEEAFEGIVELQKHTNRQEFVGEYLSRESNGFLSKNRQTFRVAGRFIDNDYREFFGEWQEDKCLYDFDLDLSK